MNKSFSLFCFSFVACGLCAQGQLPNTSAPIAPATTTVSAVPIHHSVSMEVNVVGNGGAAAVKNKTQTDHGKYTGVNGAALTTTTFQDKTSQNHRTVLSIAVRNFNQQPDQVQLEWYFFAEPLGRAKEYIFDSATSNVSLKAGETQTITAASKEVTTTVTRSTTGAPGYDSLTSRQESGTRLKGWVVRIMAEGKVLQVRGSDSKYEDIGRDDAQIQAYKQPPSTSKW